LIPTGMELVELLSPSGMAGMGMVPWSPTPIPASPPREAAPSNRSSQGRKAHVRKGPLAPKYIYALTLILTRSPTPPVHPVPDPYPSSPDSRAAREVRPRDATARGTPARARGSHQQLGGSSLRPGLQATPVSILHRRSPVGLRDSAVRPRAAVTGQPRWRLGTQILAAATRRDMVTWIHLDLNLP